MKTVYGLNLWSQLSQAPTIPVVYVNFRRFEKPIRKNFFIGYVPAHVQILKDELKARTLRNPSYSLRAMAQGFRMDSSALCRILNGTQRMTVSNAVKILDRFELGPSERTVFCDSICNEKVNEIHRIFDHQREQVIKFSCP